MKKILKSFINILKKVIIYAINITRLAIISAAICSILLFSLILINSIMGIFIDLDIYLIIYGVLSIGMTIGLVLFNSRRIFGKTKKIKKATKVISNKPIKVKSTIKTKKKIS